ncbi:hypothetical protein P154DRAFT_114475 [Amniculicola lignicola CBS 123094]|uniref:Uncharacterized protein n=1 Tax=Amniculicola lignicola CBS 123094 TaxID=1392246 RepID=A0A6A5X0P5_9PLEO|nr:hypothetical protein P154DRAFT_114475 [Amniculicola lignicola CBS 123094]
MGEWMVDRRTSCEPAVVGEPVWGRTIHWAVVLTMYVNRRCLLAASWGLPFWERHSESILTSADNGHLARRLVSAFMNDGAAPLRRYSISSLPSGRCWWLSSRRACGITASRKHPATTRVTPPCKRAAGSPRDSRVAVLVVPSRGVLVEQD